MSGSSGDGGGGEDQLARFERLLLACLNGEDNALRSKAEEHLTRQRTEHAGQVVSLLMMMLLRSRDSKVRSLSAVLLRQHLDILDKKLWAFEKLPVDRRAALKKALMTGIVNTAEEDLRRKITDCASELAVSIIPRESLGGWADFLPFALKLCASQKCKGHRIAGFRILEHLAVWIFDEFEDDLVDKLKAATEAGLSDPDLEVRLASHKAVCALLGAYCSTDEAGMELFVPLFPRMVDLCQQLVMANRQKAARQAMEGICDALEANPDFLKPHLDGFVNTMLRIALAPAERNVETFTKQMAMETLLTLCEVKPGLARRVPQVVKAALSMAMKMMIMYEPNDEWNSGPVNDPEDEEVEWGEETVNRVCLAMGGELCAPQVLAQAKAAAQSSDWRCRSVCLRAVMFAAEGCDEEMFAALPDFLPAAVQRMIKDPHPRVRVTVATLIGQLALDFKKRFTAQYTKLCLPALCTLLADADNPRLQAQAAAAFVNWTDSCKRAALEPYIDRLASLLLANLSTENPLVEEPTVTAVSSLADTLGEDFAPYWKRFAAPMKSIWSRRLELHERLLRGKTLEAITLIGVNLTAKHFRQEALELCRIVQSLEPKLKDDDPLVSFCQQAWARLCSILKQEFVPFLPHVMPSLLHTAAMPPDIEVHDGDYRTNREGWSVVSIGDKSVAINKSKLEEKSTALNMIYCLSHDLDEAFFPWVKQVAKVVVPLLDFHYADSVRDSAFCMLSSLVTCVKSHCDSAQQGPALLHQLWTKILPTLLAAISKEVERDILLTELDALQECINLLGPRAMGPKELTALSQMAKQQLVDHFNRMHNREERRKDPLFDKQDAKRMAKANREEGHILRALAEVVGRIFRHYGASYLPIFQKLLSEQVLNLLREGRSPEQMTAGYCVLCDLVEYCQAAAQPAIKFVLPHFARGAKHANPAVRQSCVYGLGQCAQHGGDAFASVLSDCIGLLGKVITAKDSRLKDNMFATENAVSSFGKVLLYWWNAIPAERRSSLVASFLSWLPVKHDDVESKITYATLCSLFDAHGEVLVGEGKQRLAHCIKLFGFIYNNQKLIDQPTNERVLAILRKIRATWSAETAAVMQKLSDAERSKLATVFGAE